MTFFFPERNADCGDGQMLAAASAAGAVANGNPRALAAPPSQRMPGIENAPAGTPADAVQKVNRDRPTILNDLSIE